MTGREIESSLGLSLTDVPLVFRGYDRAPAERLLAQAETRYGDLFRAREQLREQLAIVETTCADALQGQDRLLVELNNVTTELAGVQARELALCEELERLDRELASHQRRELVLTRMLEAAKEAAARTRADARAEADVTLKKARERAAMLVSRGERTVESARHAAAAIEAEARAEARVIGQQAADERARLEADAEKMLDRVEAERAQLRELASRLAEDLSLMLGSTVQRLTAVGAPEPDPTSAREPEVASEPAGAMDAAEETGEQAVDAVAADEKTGRRQPGALKPAPGPTGPKKRRASRTVRRSNADAA